MQRFQNDVFFPPPAACGCLGRLQLGSITPLAGPSRIQDGKENQGVQ